MDRTELITNLHETAREAARVYFRAEAALLDILQKIDEYKIFRDLGHPSLFAYAVVDLKLSESTALNFINVAHKAVQVPALKAEIRSGNLSVSKARKIVPVLTSANQEEWLTKAKTLPQRQLEREVVAVAPLAVQAERVRYVTPERMHLSLDLDERTMTAIKRVQDLESQRTKRPATLEETLAAMAVLYLERNDPVAKARRESARPESKSERA